jgi:uncharacterized protein YdhG (YjbR/CyaY superfamily)
MMTSSGLLEHMSAPATNSYFACTALLPKEFARNIYHEEFSMTPSKSTTRKSTKKSAKGTLFTDEELAAARETARERKLALTKEEAESAALAKIAEMREPDRSMAKRIHAIIKENAPSLSPKTWYGMPAYTNDDGKVICFFQTGQKFKARYSTFGFQPDAKLDEGNMWATSFALIELTTAEEARIAALVKKAAG